MQLLSENDYIIIIGKITNTHIHQKANKICYNGKIVEETLKCTNNFLIPIELQLEEIAFGEKENNNIFTDKTYKSKKYSL